MISRVSIAVAATLVALGSGHAQSAVTPGQVPCAYDVCALRLEGGRILRGAAGERVGKIGIFATRISPIIGTSSDSAAKYARIFDRDHRKGHWLLWTGASVGAAGIAWGLHNDVFADDAGPFVLALGGLFVEVMGGERIFRSMKALSRAMWWYNRDLPR